MSLVSALQLLVKKRMCQIRYAELVFELQEYVKHHMKPKFYSALATVTLKNTINATSMEFPIPMRVKYL